MTLVFILITAFLASILTFFSGFGLGTLLTPVFFILFNDLPLAIGATALVHITNNLFKFGLMRKSINWKIGWKFALTALVGSVIGALLLGEISTITLFEWKYIHINSLNLIIGLSLLFFTLIELIDSAVLKKNPPGPVFGGVITGIIAGLTGHQGALRSAFLLKYGFSKEVFISTGIFIALLTDVGRIPIYLSRLSQTSLYNHLLEVSLAILAAIIGALIGKELLKKVTLNWLNKTVSWLIILFSCSLILGLL